MPVATGTPDNENGPDVLWQREGGLQTHPLRRDARVRGGPAGIVH